MSRTIIQSVIVECKSSHSNKFYEVVLVVWNNVLMLETYYGAIGARPKQGVNGSFTIDVITSIKANIFESQVCVMLSEANKILSSKLKKGYTGRVTSFDRIQVLNRVYANWQNNPIVNILVGTNSNNLSDFASNKLSDFATSESNIQKTQLAASAQASIEVEVVGMVGGVIKIAKVTADYRYETLGEALNPSNKSVRIGDVVHVLQQPGGFALV